MPAETQSLAEVLARHTREGHLYEKLENGRVRCFACGHRCLIPPGRDGICRVRFNEGGVLKVPFGYVAALQLDPVEKKPFFHALPGSKALSFGMLGCDYHCGYCFSGETMVVGDTGPVTLAELFEACERKESRADAELAYPSDRSVVTATGSLRRLRGVVRHTYRGDLVRLRAAYLPALRCTPDHQVYATLSPDEPPRLIRAGDLTTRHSLVVPRHPAAEGRERLDVVELLASHRVTYRVRWDLPLPARELVAAATAAGESSQSISLRIGKSASYVRHVRSKQARGLGGDTRTSGLIVAGDRVRFPGEHQPGIAASLPVDAQLGALLGLYCAEGCVVRSARRPTSNVLNFSFGLHEIELAERTRRLLKSCLNLEARLVPRPTTLGVTVSKTSAALLFEALAGGRSTEKRVPAIVASASTEVVRAFLDAYAAGDGHRYANGKVSATTVSRSLAYGVAWLVLRVGGLASVYANDVGSTATIQGRRVRRAPLQYTVVWYENGVSRRGLSETADHHLVPLRAVELEPFEGYVYNLEVEGEHSYLAGFFGVANCQNWVTSQALRDEDAVAPASVVEPGEIVSAAKRKGARIVTSTYNEPLITSEWAVEVFKAAKAEGLVCSYVSNGNGTEEVLEYIRPWVRLYKVDLKGFRDRPYRDLGGTLERVLATIRSLHEKGFWVEIVTLVVPGFNDSPEELRDIARFLVSVSPDVPWHVTAFHPDYKMDDRPSTSVSALLRAAEIGAAEGLNFVYAGNLPGSVRSFENTYCPGCRALLVERVGYRILENRLGASGRCPECQRSIPGVWAI
jgi:pyruvate formate lyase activating enzyme